MSLRAKMEAVIYAAEEPVTLAQLSALFAAEALEERAARLAAGAALPGESEAQGSFEAAPRSAEIAADEHADVQASDSAIEQAAEHPEQVSATQPDGFAGEAKASEASGDVSGEADEAKRVARLRDREAREEIRRVLEELVAGYENGDRGMEIREIAGGYRVATKPEYHDAVRGFVKSLKPPMKLSLQALETLAVIAYKQPVTAPEVSDIRGVDSGGVLGSLISRKLVTTAGRKQVIGRPILYKTTKEFLLRFGLKDLAELPSMEEFEKMAGELVEAEPAAQMDLPVAPQETSRLETSELEEGETPVQIDEPGERAAPSIDEEPAAAADVQAAPELAEEREREELEANARANVQVDDESSSFHDLPGVTRDTAGRVDIDSVPRTRELGSPDEDH